MDNERAMTMGLDLSIPRHLFFADSYFHYVLKEKSFSIQILFQLEKKSYQMGIPTGKTMSYQLIGKKY